MHRIVITGLFYSVNHWLDCLKCFWNPSFLLLAWARMSARHVGCSQFLSEIPSWSSVWCPLSQRPCDQPLRNTPWFFFIIKIQNILSCRDLMLWNESPNLLYDRQPTRILNFISVARRPRSGRVNPVSS